MKFGKQRNGLRRFRCAQCGKTYTEGRTGLFGSMTVPEDKALLAIQLLLEGTSVRSAERITQLHRDTILRLLEVCSVCREPITHETEGICADDDGKLAHSDCYVQQVIASRKPPTPDHHA
jgi:transposase-like protein